jgi:hypothetical protein
MNALGLVVRTWNDAPICRRDSDGYASATAMCQANGKLYSDYQRLERTTSYLAALGDSLGVPADQLVLTTTSGPNHLRGTWVHPRLAVDLARWLSPEFAVWMDGWFLEAAAGHQQQPPRINTTNLRPKPALRPARTWTEQQRLAILSNPVRKQRAIERICRAAIRHRLTHVMPRDAVQWRVFGRCPVTTREMSALLQFAADVHNLGQMVPSPRSTSPCCLRVDLDACRDFLDADDLDDDGRNVGELLAAVTDAIDEPTQLTTVPRMLRQIQARLPEWAIYVS